MDEATKNFWTRHHHLPRISWRLVARGFFAVLFALVCLATLVGLFYLEEDIRGQLAWRHYVKAARARGIELDWQAYVPPSIPDEQNFAMSPLFAGFFDYQVITNHVVWRDNDINGRAALISLREPGSSSKDSSSWKLGRPVDLKQWQAYFPSAKRPQTNYWPAPTQPGAPAGDVLFALQKLDPQIEQLRTAAARPFSRFPVHYEEKPNALLMHLSYLKNLAQVCDLRAIAELELGENSSAFEDTKLAFRCGDALDSEPFLVSQRVRCSVIEMDLQPVWEGLRNHKWTDSQLEEFQSYFSKQDLLARFVQIRKAEVAFTCAWIDLLATDLSAFQWTTDKNGSADRYNAALNAHLLPRGWVDQNQLSAARFYYETMSNDVDAVTHRVFPNLSDSNATLVANLPENAYKFIFRSMPTFSSPQRFAQIQGYLDLAQVACALERYRVAFGKYPETLDALVPRFVEKPPRDVIDGESLKYHLTAGGNFTLYSIGWRQKDSGGAFPVEPDEAARSYGGYRSEMDDWVWRYPDDDGTPSKP